MGLVSVILCYLPTFILCVFFLNSGNDIVRYRFWFSYLSFPLRFKVKNLCGRVITTTVWFLLLYYRRDTVLVIVSVSGMTWFLYFVEILVTLSCVSGSVSMIFTLALHLFNVFVKILAKVSFVIDSGSVLFLLLLRYDSWNVTEAFLLSLYRFCVFIAFRLLFVVTLFCVIVSLFVKFLLCFNFSNFSVALLWSFVAFKCG